MNPGRPANQPSKPSTAVARWLDRAGFLTSSVLACAAMVAISSVWISTVRVYSTGPEPTSELTDLGVLAFLAVLLAMPFVFLRRRMPWIVMAVGAILTLLMALDPFLVLLTAPTIITFRPPREAWWAGGIATGLTLQAALRDGLRGWMESSWALLFVTDPGVYGEPNRALQVGITLGLAVVALVVALGLGVIGRTRRTLGQTREEARSERAQRAQAEAAQHTAEQEAVQERVRAADLEETVSRQEERERLAQEIHDALAHRLSLISLQSGAVEKISQDSDPTVAEAAEVLRTNAHRSLEDLRDLIQALREPAGPGRPAPEEPAPTTIHGLQAIPELLDNARQSGMDIRTTVMLADTEQAAELTHRVAFRMVQEALTNAFKHAPGQPVDVQVRSGADEGIRIRVANPIAADSQLPGSGSGLLGMQERVHMAGGQIQIGPREAPRPPLPVSAPGQPARTAPPGREFVVEASLPWELPRP